MQTAANRHMDSRRFGQAPAIGGLFYSAAFTSRTAKWASGEPGLSAGLKHGAPPIGAKENEAPSSLARNAFTTSMFSARVMVHVEKTMLPPGATWLEADFRSAKPVFANSSIFSGFKRQRISG